MKIALAQLNYTIGDIEGNTAKIVDAIERAKREGADVVLFAEQAVSGTPAFDLLRKTTFLELCEEALDKIASHCNGIAAVVGSPVLTAEGTISAAVVMEQGEITRYVGKHHISARREMGFLNSAKGFECVTIRGHKCIIVVGDDLRRVEELDRSAEVILSINARKYSRGSLHYRYETMRNLAFVEGKDIVLINQVGGATEIVYDGSSGVLNRKGEPVLLMESFAEDFAIYDTEAEYEALELPASMNRTSLVYRAACMG
ncbi:MAG: NAD+ synthase, partial [Alistipes sp.]|nr:NAD+ synthase [Alistipes sp.]